MKSYKDTKLALGLLFLGIAAGVTGRFFETEHFSFPAAGNLNQAAAIVATETNIVGTKTPVLATVRTVAVSVAKRDVADAVPAPDIDFAQYVDCTTPFSIRPLGDATIGFLCLDANAKDIENTVRESAAQVNALIVSPAFSAKNTPAENETIAEKIADGGAIAIVGQGARPAEEIGAIHGAPTVYGLGSSKPGSPAEYLKLSFAGTTITGMSLEK